MRFFTSFLVFMLWTNVSLAQSNPNCSMLDLEMDTLVCEIDTIVIERSIFVCNRHFESAITYKSNHKEFMWLMYKYDRKNKIKKVSFWTYYRTNGGGYTSGYRLAVMKLRGNNYKLYLKNGFLMSMDFAKAISKCY